MTENPHYNFHFSLKPFAVLFQPKAATAIVFLGVAHTGWTSGKEFKGLSAFNLNILSLLDTLAKEMQLKGHSPHSLLECQSLKKRRGRSSFQTYT